VFEPGNGFKFRDSVFFSSSFHSPLQPWHLIFSGCSDRGNLSRLRLQACIFSDSWYSRKGFVSMGKKLYVGNLSYNTTEDGLRNFFAGYGNVVSVKIILDRETGNSKGFGFIEMGTDEEANAAIAGTNGQEFDGRQLRVNEAMDKPRDRRPGGDRW
jgi:hypothetical protein